MKEHQTIFPLAARTATPTAGTIHAKSLGGIFFINVTAVAASPSVVIAVKGQDPLTGTEYTIATVTVTGVGLTVLRVHPSLTLAPNSVSDILPAAVVVSATHADVDSITYSVSFVGVN